MCLDEDSILALIEGHLDDPARAGIESHLDDCEDCRRLVAASLGSPRVSAAEAETLDADDTTIGSRISRGATLSRYVVLETIGAGGMGVVHLAYDPELDRKVAIKLLWPGDASSDDARRDRVLREAQAMARLTHPNVVSVYDVGTVGEQVFVVMELVQGTTLGKWMTAERRGVRAIVDVFTKAGRGLAAAHAAGLVHRDFKPENVLLGDDGRVLVTDFGLARSAGAPESRGPESDGAALTEVRLTRTGAVVGTPAYMSPEQLDGAKVDARSDVFSFSVALFEALYHVRPFEGDTAREIQRSIVERRVRKPPHDAGVPAWLHALVTSGLDPDPEKRPQSMDAVLEVLARDPNAARRRLVTLALATLVTGAIALAIALPLRERSLVCKGSDEKLASAWNGARREAVAKAIRASDKPWAEATAASVLESLDAYGRSWAGERTEACEATRVTKTQSEELLDLRMRCLDGRLQEMSAAVDVLSKPDPKLLDGARRVASSLPTLAACADADALHARVPPPSDASVRAEVDRLRAEIGEVKAMRYLGKYKEGEARASEIAARAKKLDYAPLTAEASLLWARYLDLVSEFTKSGDAARTALVEAERGRDRKLAAESLAELVWIVGHQQGEPKWGYDYAKHARALLAGLGGDLEIEANVAGNESALLIDEGKMDASIPPARESAEKYRAALGERNPRAAMGYENLAVSLTLSNHLDEALKYEDQALALYAAAVGEHHPLYAHALFNTADTLRQVGKYPEAREKAERALALIRETLGEEHAQVASAENALALIATAEGHYDEAIGLFERAVKLAEKVRGPEHVFVAHYLSGLGEPLARSKRWKDARATYERAVRIYEKNSETGASIARARSGLAEALVELDDAKAAMAIAEAALAWQDPNDEPKERAATRFQLARALWSTKGDAARARELAEKAIGELGADAKGAAEIRAALAAHAK